MSTRYQPTPVDELSIEFDEQRQRRAQVRISDWADYHDVYPWLLPLENRVQKPLETAATVQEYLDSLGELTETFTRKEFGLQHNGDDVTRNILRLFKITEFDTGGQRPVRYRNPNYKHYEARTVAVESRAERIKHYETWKTIPTINSMWFAHHWGVTRSAVSDWVRRNADRSYSDQLQANHRRMGRTIATHKQWTGQSIRRISEPLPVCYNTAKRWVTRYATTTDWMPPEQPCDKRWFMASP